MKFDRFAPAQLLRHTSVQFVGDTRIDRRQLVDSRVFFLAHCVASFDSVNGEEVIKWSKISFEAELKIFTFVKNSQWWDMGYTV